LLNLWILRILVPLKGYRRWCDSEGYCEIPERLVDALGIPGLKGYDTPRAKRSTVVRHLQRRHAQAEKSPSRLSLPRALATNCARIAGLIGLDAVAQRILAFTVLLHQDALLQDATELLGEVSSTHIHALLSTLLGHPEAAIRQAFSPAGQLMQSGLVKIDHASDYNLRMKLDLITRQFADRMTSRANDPLDLFRDSIIPVPEPELAVTDFSHVQALVDIVLPLLRGALSTGRCGVNVLLHGKPGTGKSQFARVLAATLDTQLFQVSSEDEDGDPIEGEKRLRAYRAALSVVARSKAMLVFDEAEDVFSGGHGFFSPPSPAQKSKAWVNRTLESNPVPCLWLSNAIEDMDPAFIRRFDVVCELPIPPRHQRARVIEALCGDLVTPATIRRLAGSEHLAPAVIARAATVARAICNDLPAGEEQTVVTRLVDHTLIAQGHPPLPPADYLPLMAAYDPACAPADTDLEALAAGIAGAPGARLCLYGPPGTGKTAFARWLAQYLDKPLLVRRVSDLIGAYVGESERNLAAAFRQASQEGAVFLLDEVDSFLQDRRQARHSWEVTLVNELLTQMEAFDGIFIAATNLMDSIDPAALRRFDLKLQFTYLQPQQAWQLLKNCAATIGLPEPGQAHKTDMASMHALTPGDFATVTRQSRFQPFADLSALCAALAAECAARKDAPRRPIGFV
jgi:SpoVK/Ycf46/Vps4 family AAA+-type ATPase